MGFSEKMRDSLGAEGARIEVVGPSTAVQRGSSATFSVVIIGGTKPASVDALTLRLVEATRHWVDADGTTHSDEAIAGRDDRSSLTAGWTRSTTATRQLELGVTVEPGARHAVDVELDIPQDARATSPAIAHALSVQADIKGQIDPTGQTRVTVE
jgi:sporulation-control protein spo0M